MTPHYREAGTTPQPSIPGSDPHTAYARQAGYSLSQADAPNLLLLLHGLGGDRHQPLKLIAGLERPDLAILAPDARAHGETSAIGENADFELDALANDVVALLDLLQQSGKPTYVAGISMGAAVALRLALGPRAEAGTDTETGTNSDAQADASAEHPLIPRLAGLALVRPAFSDQPFPANLEPLHRIGDLLAADPDGLYTFRRSQMFTGVAAVSASSATSLLEQFTKPQAVVRSVRLREVPRNSAWQDGEPSRLTTPTLVLGAPRDPVHPITLAQRLAVLIPYATYAELPSRDEKPQHHEEATRAAVQEHLNAHLT